VVRVQLPDWMVTAIKAGWKPPYVPRGNLMDQDPYTGGPISQGWMRQEYEKRRAWEYANPGVEDQVEFNPKYETRTHGT